MVNAQTWSIDALYCGPSFVHIEKNFYHYYTHFCREIPPHSPVQSENYKDEKLCNYIQRQGPVNGSLS